MSFSIESLKDSLHTGFIDKESVSDASLTPTLLLNDKKAATKVLTTLLHELATCKEYYFSVAFISTSGVAAIINVLQEIDANKVKGKILASQYLDFTHPEALRRLLRHKNIELRINTKSKHHAKGYIFRHEKYYNIIIGSSNLTSPALCENKELNIKTTAAPESKLVDGILKEFTSDFEDSRIVDERYLKEYEDIYRKALKKRVFQEDELAFKVKPNLMQRDALKGIESIRNRGGDKAIIISATGTGKTYLCAFDVQQANPKKFLFIVHRENIASKALLTFKSQIGNKVEYGVYSGQEKDVNADYLFSTVQTISREDNMKAFKPDHFDYIVIDETHRSGADSYRRILDYFRPRFLLGMTATPERTDGYDIFKQFDHNVAYEIRLHKALEENMLAPFHYYGVTDILIDGELVDENTSISDLTTKERVKQIVEKSQFYGTDTGIIRCLVFCRSIEECKDLSLGFRQKGLRSIYLTGSSTSEEREEAIERIQSDDESKRIEYIFTYDIFNEGVDIPLVNQVILLRPTSSSIVFVQQIGRGLRKARGKEYLTIIDFIGNYKNNYLIPIALFGDSSYNKDTLRKLLVAGSSLIPGSSTINFEEIAKKRIFESIDTANMLLVPDLVRDYQMLKFRLGRIPNMVDFLENGMRDPGAYIDRFRSYYNFLVKYESTINGTLNDFQKEVLEVYCKEINNGISLIESEILLWLLEHKKLNIPEFADHIFSVYKISFDNSFFESALRSLNFIFSQSKSCKNIVSQVGLSEAFTCKKINDYIVLGEKCKEILSNNQFNAFLKDNILYSIFIFKSRLNVNNYRNRFFLYQKYSRKDVFRLLGWDKEPSAQLVGGYMLNKRLKVCPIFVTYHKAVDVPVTSKYEDEFDSKQIMTWYSKSNRKLSSPEIIAFKEDPAIRLLLFVKKNDDEGISFYYLGDVKPIENSFFPKKMVGKEGKSVSVVEMKLRLNDPVPDLLFEYIVDCESKEKQLNQGEV